MTKEDGLPCEICDGRGWYNWRKNGSCRKCTQTKTRRPCVKCGTHDYYPSGGCKKCKKDYRASVPIEKKREYAENAKEHYRIKMAAAVRFDEWKKRNQ